MKWLAKWLFNFSILALLWSVYYLAKRATAGVLTVTDAVVCGVVILLCVIDIAYYIYKMCRRKKGI